MSQEIITRRITFKRCDSSNRTDDFELGDLVYVDRYFTYNIMGFRCSDITTQYYRVCEILPDHYDSAFKKSVRAQYPDAEEFYMRDGRLLLREIKIPSINPLPSRREGE